MRIGERMKKWNQPALQELNINETFDTEYVSLNGNGNGKGNGNGNSGSDCVDDLS